MTLEHLLQYACLCIPEPNCLIVRSRGKHLAILRERYVTDVAVIALERLLRCENLCTYVLLWRCWFPSTSPGALRLSRSEQPIT